MRITFRSGRDVVINGCIHRARVYPLGDDDQLKQTPWGLQGQEKVRLLLPPLAQVMVRDALVLDGKLYACCAVRFYPTHVQADFRRNAL
ncbi:MAG: hypothetical protein IKT57_05925 [Clostridia bacterium]|nr:hypothetical protein [Clostridia bacterium]